MTNMKYEYRAYQEETENALLKDVLSDPFCHPVVAVPTGGGKTKILSSFIYKYLEEKPTHNIVVISHTESILEQDHEGISSFFPGINIGLYSSGLGSKNIQKITVAGIQSIYKKGKLFKNFDLAIVDECFVKNTIISTPLGNRNIEDIKIGDKVYNKKGIGIVKNTFKKLTKNTLILGLSNGKKIECTHNHKFFTKTGWTKAKNMEGKILFRKKDMSNMQQKFWTKYIPIRKYSKRKIIQRKTMLFKILFKNIKKSYARYKNYRKNDKNIIKNKTQANHKRREWNRRHFSRIFNAQKFRRWMEKRVLNFYKNGSSKWNLSKLLQNRHSKSFFKDRYRNRWVYSWKKKKNIGQKKRQFTKKIRVESISYKKSKNYRFVYDLQISRHPSYYANGYLVHNCHTVPTKGNGMYQQFFNSTDMVRVGLTATHFRTGHGYVHKGKGAMFNKLSYDLCTMEKFNKLVSDKYLTELFSKPPKFQLDTSNVKELASDYNLKDLSDTFDRDAITRKAIKETIRFGKNYKSWLVFAIDIEHANNITKELIKNGINARALHSNESKEEQRLSKKEFKQVKYTAIVSVGMITTGFDAPNIDLIVLLRPTKSPVLHVQMIGRGLRVFEGKTHCLVLDFAGNISRLGPINCVEVPNPAKKKNGLNGEPIVKTCPNCGCLHHPTVKICNVCGHKFEFISKLRENHSQQEIVKKEKPPKWLDVTDIMYRIHEKRGNPASLRVTYKCGLYTVNEYVCYNHAGFPKHKANHWIDVRSDFNYTFLDVDDIYSKSKYLDVPKQILVDTNKRYPDLLDAKF